MNGARALLACVLCGCSLVSGFDDYRFTADVGTDAHAFDAGDASQLADVGTDAHAFDAGDASQLADVGTDAHAFDPLAPDCCGLGCAMCLDNATNPRRCFTMARGWICAVDCGPTCAR